MTEKPSEFIKAIARPFLTFTGLFAWIIMIIVEAPYPDEFQWAVLVMLAWWFGERILGKIKTS